MTESESGPGPFHQQKAVLSSVGVSCCYSDQHVVLMVEAILSILTGVFSMSVIVTFLVHLFPKSSVLVTPTEDHDKSPEHSDEALCH